ncbi:MAG: hypothetical protein EOO43_27045 [Flavobacterium sp.]|nr:MAG: hypothetical protein EOO43_27045 [Flavobacterium sp.]
MDDFVTNYKKNMTEDFYVICLMSPTIHLRNKFEIQGYVWFGQWGEYFEIFNIVPSKSGSLTYSEYNEILRLFYHQLLLPAVEQLNLEVELILTEPNKSIDSIAGREIADALKLFSDFANKSTGNSHPMDFDRWVYLVCLAHRKNSALNTDDLVRWLKENGWSEDTSWELGLEYEYSRNLLEYYDKNFNS